MASSEQFAKEREILPDLVSCSIHTKGVVNGMDIGELPNTACFRFEFPDVTLFTIVAEDVLASKPSEYWSRAAASALAQQRKQKGAA